MAGNGLQVVYLEEETTETRGLTEIYTEDTELCDLSVNICVALLRGLWFLPLKKVLIESVYTNR